MDPMHLPDVEGHEGTGDYAEAIRAAKSAGMPMPQIWHLFAFKRELGDALGRVTHAAMRGPSPLSPGMRELIAAFTSRRNQCLF
jgi:hypothetical protein